MTSRTPPGDLHEHSLLAVFAHPDDESLAASLRSELTPEDVVEEAEATLVVEGVDLEAFLRRRFRVGAVEMEGLRICAPCKYLVRVTGQERIFEALVRRGGLRARIHTEGEIRVGDLVAPAASGG